MKNELVKIKKLVELRDSISKCTLNLNIGRIDINADMSLTFQNIVYFRPSDEYYKKLDQFPFKVVKFDHLVIEDTEITDNTTLPTNGNILDVNKNKYILYRPEGFKGIFYNTRVVAEFEMLKDGRLNVGGTYEGYLRMMGK